MGSWWYRICKSDVWDVGMARAQLGLGMELRMPAEGRQSRGTDG